MSYCLQLMMFRIVSYVICMFLVVLLFIMFLFFFKQKTAYEMRISDWSSDVCSSDLLALPQLVFEGLMRGNHIFLHLLLISLLILMAVYPRKLNHARLIAGSMLAAVLACQINENLQLIDLPLHRFYLMLLLYYQIGRAHV